MHLGRPFRHVTGILAGTPVHVAPGDVERVWSLFDAENAARDKQTEP
jgi:circadian clock protein KaiC